MAKTQKEPVELHMLDVGDELYVIDAMLTAVNNFNKFEKSEYDIVHSGMVMIIAARIMQLKDDVDKHNKNSTN